MPDRILYGITSPERQAYLGSVYYRLHDGREVGLFQVTETPEETVADLRRTIPDVACIGPVASFIRNDSFFGNQDRIENKWPRHAFKETEKFESFIILPKQKFSLDPAIQAMLLSKFEKIIKDNDGYKPEIVVVDAQNDFMPPDQVFNFNPMLGIENTTAVACIGQSDQCTCEIGALMLAGCKCGHMKK